MDKESQVRLGMVEELRRRKVLRSTTLYAVTSWCLLQWSDMFFEAMELPEWLISLLLTAIVLGFPVVVALSWVFDITPGDGLREDQQVEPPQPDRGSRLVDVMVVALLMVTVILLINQ